MFPPIFDLLAREHPAFVHVPLGTAAVLPVAMAVAQLVKDNRPWKVVCLFLASVAFLGSLAALFSGLLWGRLINLIAPGSFLAHPASPGQVLQRLLQRHELLALSGAALGALTLFLLARSLGRQGRGMGLQVWGAVLLWVGCWVACGRIGGTLVFGDAETNRAAAAADLVRRGDAEADLPVRALDFASLEPTRDAPVRSPAHGGRWARIWVTASALDPYRKERSLPTGAYAVLTTSEDFKGRPSPDPGPLYFLETRADGSKYAAFYWPRVPEARRKETGGEDFVYLRSPDPRLKGCLECHGR